MDINDFFSNAVSCFATSWKIARLLSWIPTEKCYSESFEMQTELKDIQTSTNDSLSNNINKIEISLYWIFDIDHFLILWSTNEIRGNIKKYKYELIMLWIFIFYKIGS